MDTIRRLVKKYFTNFTYFYRYIRYRILILLLLNIAVGVLDGFGIALFLPLLEIVSSPDGTATAEQMGNLAFLVNGLESMGLPLNLTVVLLTMLVFFSFKGVFKFISTYFQVVYQQFFMRVIRVQNIAALANYSYYDFVNADAGRIQNTLSGEINKVNSAFNNYLHVMQQSVLIVVYTGMAFVANPQFAILVALGGLLTNLAFSKLYNITKRLSRELTKHNHGFQGLLIQQVALFKYFKATGLIRNYAQRLINMVYEIEIARRKMGVLAAMMQSIREPLLIAVVVLVVLIQVNILGGSLILIILSILFFYRALTAVMQLQTYWNSFLGTVGSLENMTAFTNELKQGEEKTGKGKFGKFGSALQLKEVSFNYGNISVLHDIDITIQKNQTVALVGESGSGKTTLMNILSGLLKPQKGAFLIDGSDSRNLNISTFQKRIGYITQEPVIFNDTIFNNVTFWDEKSDDNMERFYAAIKRASVYDFVMHETPGKEDTLLGNNGINLSGGQKQRISIARELYKDVDFLFMDEATSSLDSETERKIQESIDNLKGQYTIVIIAHRLSTIKNADQVVVLRKGSIERTGSYQELIFQSASFQKMVELQEV